MKSNLLNFFPFCSRIDDIWVDKQSLKNTQILDVRRPREWAETGVIKGSYKISLIDDNENLNGNFLQEIRSSGIDPNSSLSIICRVGRRSRRVAIYLKKHGFSKVRNLNGGINEVIKIGYPLTKG